MTSTSTYLNVHAVGGPREMSVPPLEDLRAEDWASLPRMRYIAAQEWWINADHPGFGFNAEHTADCMRQAGFTDAEIHEVLEAVE